MFNTEWQKLYDFIMGAEEDLTGYLGVISSDHAYIHSGLAFTSFVDTGEISAAYRIGFTTPATKYVHWRPLGITTSANYVQAVMTEADSFTSGTAVAPVNRNRISTGVTTMQAFAKGVTSTPAGVILGITGIGTAGNPTARSGGGAGADQEIVLKRNTSYVITLTPAGATTCSLSLFWYEEAGG